MKTIFAFLAWVGLSATLMAANAPKIEPAEAAKQVASGKAVLIDVREPKEWHETGVAEPAVLLSKSELDENQGHCEAFLARNKDKQIIVYCRSGNRSGEVANALAAKGYKTANAGGLKDWVDAGLPTRKVEVPERNRKP